MHLITFRARFLLIGQGEAHSVNDAHNYITFDLKLHHFLCKKQALNSLICKEGVPQRGTRRTGARKVGIKCEG